MTMTVALLKQLADVARHDAVNEPAEDEQNRLYAIAGALDTEADALQLATTGKACKCCGAVYSVEGWIALPFVGLQSLGLGECLELRNCVGVAGKACSTTLAINVPAPDAAAA